MLKHNADFIVYQSACNNLGWMLKGLAKLLFKTRCFSWVRVCEMPIFRDIFPLGYEMPIFHVISPLLFMVWFTPYTQNTWETNVNEYIHILLLAVLFDTWLHFVLVLNIDHLKRCIAYLLYSNFLLILPGELNYLLFVCDFVQYWFFFFWHLRVLYPPVYS